MFYFILFYLFISLLTVLSQNRIQAGAYALDLQRLSYKDEYIVEDSESPQEHLSSSEHSYRSHNQQHQCIHDKVFNHFQKYNKGVVYRLSATDEFEEAYQSRRRQDQDDGTPISIQTQQQRPIQINISSVDLTNTDKYCTKAGEFKPDFLNGDVMCGRGDVLTFEKRAFLLNFLLPKAVQVIDHSFSIIPDDSPIVVPQDECRLHTIPAEHSTSGVAGDFVLYVAAGPTTGYTVAWASTCACEKRPCGHNGQPGGRPVVGAANFGARFIDVTTVAHTRDQQVATATHELLHALGFSKLPTRRVAQRGKFVDVFEGQQTRSIYRAFIGCSTLHGPEMEGEEATVGSHFDRRVLPDELMAPSDGMILSPLTLAVFEDLGYYSVNYSAFSKQQLVFGRNAGCGFVEQRCDTEEGGRGKWWCFDNSSADSCTTDYSSIGQCNVQRHSTKLLSPYQYFEDPFVGGSVFFDGCPRIEAYSNLICNRGNGTPSTLGHVFAEDSRCIRSTLVAQGYVSSASPLRCHRTRCNEQTGQIEIHVPGSGEDSGGEIWLACIVPGQILTRIPGYKGHITCPSDPLEFCMSAQLVYESILPTVFRQPNVAVESGNSTLSGAALEAAVASYWRGVMCTTLNALFLINSDTAGGVNSVAGWNILNQSNGWVLYLLCGVFMMFMMIFFAQFLWVSLKLAEDELSFDNETESAADLGPEGRLSAQTATVYRNMRWWVGTGAMEVSHRHHARQNRQICVPLCDTTENKVDDSEKAKKEFESVAPVEDDVYIVDTRVIPASATQIHTWGESIASSEECNYQLRPSCLITGRSVVEDIMYHHAVASAGGQSGGGHGCILDYGGTTARGLWYLSGFSLICGIFLSLLHLLACFVRFVAGISSEPIIIQGRRDTGTEGTAYTAAFLIAYLGLLLLPGVLSFPSLLPFSGSAFLLSWSPTVPCSRNENTSRKQMGSKKSSVGKRRGWYWSLLNVMTHVLRLILLYFYTFVPSFLILLSASREKSTSASSIVSTSPFRSTVDTGDADIKDRVLPVQVREILLTVALVCSAFHVLLFMAHHLIIIYGATRARNFDNSLQTHSSGNNSTAFQTQYVNVLPLHSEHPVAEENRADDVRSKGSSVLTRDRQLKTCRRCVDFFSLFLQVLGLFFCSLAYLEFELSGAIVTMACPSVPSISPQIEISSRSDYLYSSSAAEISPAKNQTDSAQQQRTRQSYYHPMFYVFLVVALFPAFMLPCMCVLQRASFSFSETPSILTILEQTPSSRRTQRSSANHSNTTSNTSTSTGGRTDPHVLLHNNSQSQREEDAQQLGSQRSPRHRAVATEMSSSAKRELDPEHKNRTPKITPSQNPLSTTLFKRSSISRQQQQQQHERGLFVFLVVDRYSDGTVVSRLVNGATGRPLKEATHNTAARTDTQMHVSATTTPPLNLSLPPRASSGAPPLVPVLRTDNFSRTLNAPVTPRASSSVATPAAVSPAATLHARALSGTTPDTTRQLPQHLNTSNQNRESPSKSHSPQPSRKSSVAPSQGSAMIIQVLGQADGEDNRTDDDSDEMTVTQRNELRDSFKQGSPKKTVRVGDVHDEEDEEGQQEGGATGQSFPLPAASVFSAAYVNTHRVKSAHKK